MDKILDYSFKEVSVVPSTDEKFFQLFVGSMPCPFVYSESHLKKCFSVLLEESLD